MGLPALRWLGRDVNYARRQQRMPPDLMRYLDRAVADYQRDQAAAAP